MSWTKLRIWRSPRLLLSWWTIYESTSPIPAAITQQACVTASLTRSALQLCSYTHTHTAASPALCCMQLFSSFQTTTLLGRKIWDFWPKCSVLFFLCSRYRTLPSWPLLCLVASSEAIGKVPKQFRVSDIFVLISRFFSADRYNCHFNLNFDSAAEFLKCWKAILRVFWDFWKIQKLIYKVFFKARFCNVL